MSKKRQRLRAEKAQSNKMTCVQSQNKSRSGTESRLSNSHHFFFYPPTTLPLASFRRFGLLGGFSCKTMAEQNKDSWVTVSGLRMLGLAATLVQYLLQLLPGESVFAECGSNSFGKTKYCAFDRDGWQFFCQVSIGREYRVHLWDPDLRHFVPVSARVCAPPWAAQCSHIEIFFH